MEESPHRTEAAAHIAILPTPGMGHLIPLMEFARKLHNLNTNISITFIIPIDVASSLDSQKSHITNFPTVNTVFLPPDGGENLPDSATLEERIVTGVIRSLPSLRRVLTELNETNPISGFVFDLFTSFALDMVKELGIPAYMFFSSSATLLWFSLYLPELDALYDCEYRDLPEPVKIPGGVPVHGSDWGDTMQDRKSEAYKSVLEMCRKYSLADGIIVNSFLDLEPDVFNALDGKRNTPPVYHVGPLIRTVSTPAAGDKETECLTWLDKNPAGSVLYVSFGSGGTLSSEQLTQLALGLESSGQKFVLVVRKPNDGTKSAAYFGGGGGESEHDPFHYLPSGFIERTREKGFVLPEWAPQIEILRHTAVGGFLTHCGWNSTLESIVHGVPLIALPLFAEQKLNAVILSEALKVAIRLQENENGIVESDEISKMVRRLIDSEKEEEEEKMRERMWKLKEAAAKAIGIDGSSTQSLAALTEKWMHG